MRLLITRPQPDAGALADKLQALGVEAVISPLLHIEDIDSAPLALAGVQALIATSRNGLHALARRGEYEDAVNLPIYCVGEATGALARFLGLDNVMCGEGNAHALAQLIRETCDPAKGALLHLVGEHTARDLQGMLQDHGFKVAAPAIYRAVANTSFSDMVRDELAAGRIDGVVLMSPRTAAIFVRLIEKSGLTAVLPSMICYCLSRNVARKFDGFSRKPEIKIARQPSLRDMVALIKETFLS